MRKIDLYKSFFEQSYESGVMPQDEYVKKVVAAVKKVLKGAEKDFNMDSTIMSRNSASSRRVVSGYATLTQIQGQFTRQFPELKISMKVSPMNEFNVVVKAGERHFFTDILVPRDQLASHSFKALTSRILKRLEGLDVQDYATQDDIRTNKKTRHTRPEIQESRRSDAKAVDIGDGFYLHGTGMDTNGNHYASVSKGAGRVANIQTNQNAESAHGKDVEEIASDEQAKAELKDFYTNFIYRRSHKPLAPRTLPAGSDDWR